MTWGKRLALVVRDGGGLKGAHSVVEAVVGGFIGSRNTFAKLFYVDRAADLDDTEALRAWLLLTALGEDPTGWDVGDDALPVVFRSPYEIRRRLRAERKDRDG